VHTEQLDEPRKCLSRQRDRFSDARWRLGADRVRINLTRKRSEFAPMRRHRQPAPDKRLVDLEMELQSIGFFAVPECLVDACLRAREMDCALRQIERVPMPLENLARTSERSDDTVRLTFWRRRYRIPADFLDRVSPQPRAESPRQQLRAQADAEHRQVSLQRLANRSDLGGEMRELRNRELRLLEILLAAPERIFSKAQICDRLFSYAESVTDNAIEVYVARLRKKLEGSGAKIETVRGIGYRLTAE
jgi:DNA-binding winged helix-turn-helix (wHTH) protein